MRLIRQSRVQEIGTNRTYFKVYLCTKNKQSAYCIEDACLPEDLKIQNKSSNKMTCHRLLKISLIPGKSTRKIGWKYYFICLRSFKHDVRSTVQSTVKGTFQRRYVTYVAQMYYFRNEAKRVPQQMRHWSNLEEFGQSLISKAGWRGVHKKRINNINNGINLKGDCVWRNLSYHFVHSVISEPFPLWGTYLLLEGHC